MYQEIVTLVMFSYHTTNVPKGYKLYYPCDYSFNDLKNEVRDEGYNIISLKELYAMSQENINTEVKKMCVRAGWYWKDVIGFGNIVYTAFSPDIVLKKSKADNKFDSLK